MPPPSQTNGAGHGVGLSGEIAVADAVAAERHVVGVEDRVVVDEIQPERSVAVDVIDGDHVDGVGGGAIDDRRDGPGSA